MLLFPNRMLQVAATASRRTTVSFLLGLLSAPLLIITIVLLCVTVIGIPIAFILPIVYLIMIWAGQLATVYLLGSRLMRRPVGEGGLMMPLLVGTLMVAAFFVMGTLLAGPAGLSRTLALFFDLLGVLLVIGLSTIGTGAVLLSRFGSRPREAGPAPAIAVSPTIAPATSP